MPWTLRISSLFGLFILVCLTPETGDAAGVTAKSLSPVDVSSAISLARPGDIVSLPAGSITWSNPVTVTKGITIQGAGVGKTIIKSAVRNINLPMIKYQPALPSLDEPFRITGITFDGSWTGGTATTDGSRAVSIYNWTTYLITKVRIDHNKFINCRVDGVNIEGFVHGLVDNNEFYDCFKSCNVYGKFWDSWERLPIKLGSAETVVIENNQFNYSGSKTGAVISGGHGAKYTFRYNKIDNPPGYDILDAHGNQSPVTEENRNGHRGTMLVEIYENTITNAHQKSIQRIVALRGGTGIIYNNSVTPTSVCTSGLIQMWEEDGPGRFHLVPNMAVTGGKIYKSKVTHTSATSNKPGSGSTWSTYWEAIPKTATAWASGRRYLVEDVVTSGGSTFLCYLAHTSASSSQPGSGSAWKKNWMRIDWVENNAYLYSPGYDPVKDTHIWNNTFKGSLINPSFNFADDPKFIVEGRDYWTQKVPFNGSQGIGVGPLTARPTTCSGGTAFWATDQKRLYKCSSPNTWVEYYKPLPYPHPTAPVSVIAPPGNLWIVQ